MKNEKRSFKDSYSNDWICTLKQVVELKEVLLSKTTEEVRFWSDGTWTIGEEKNLVMKKDCLNLKLSTEDLYCINQNNINEIINNICYFIFGFDQSLKSKDANNFFTNKELRLNLSHSYNFVFNQGGYELHCKIKWENYNHYLLIILDDETVGFAKDVRHLINYLFTLSKQSIDRFYLISLFWS